MTDRDEFDAASRLFAYEAGTGLIRWRVSTNLRIRVGDAAGCVDGHGYVRITIALDGARRRSLAAHRVAWLLAHGAWPAGEIDHINGVKTYNRLANLRDVSRSANGMNRVRADRDSSTGLLGASRHKSGKFLAQIRQGGQYRYLGLHATPEEAHKAYCAARAGLIEKTLEAA